MKRPTPPPTSIPDGHKSPEDAPPSDLSIYSEANPLSIPALLDGPLKAAVLGLDMKYLQMTEQELKKAVKPDSQLCRLKLSFWDEYERALEKGGRKMQVQEICRGVCTREFFYSVVIKDSKKVAWIVTPPLDALMLQREMLYQGYERLRKLIMTSWWTKETQVKRDGTTIVTKKVNAAVMGQVLTAVKILQDRVHGAVLQRTAIEQRSLNLNLNKTAPDDSFDSTSLADLEKMERQLERLEKRATAVLPAAEAGITIEVTEAEMVEEGEK